MQLEGSELHCYRLMKLIGSAGMSEVYLAEDRRVRRLVAIKVVLNESASPDSDTKSARRTAQLFNREMMSIVRLDHPSILPLYDYGAAEVNGAKTIYMVMPYRPEGSLMQWLRLHTTNGRLSPENVTHLIQQAADALQHAHDHQIIHQNVKPSNFLLCEGKERPTRPDLLLADFRIAWLNTATSSMSQSVRDTPTFMAPEQWEGHPVPATDQYALAIMAYQLLTGHPPFIGDREEVKSKHLRELTPSPSAFNPTLPAALDEVILRALAKRPEERFPSIRAFAQAFALAIQKTETVFFSYAQKDKALRDRLEEHLSILKYRGLITSWYDKEITAGDDWEREINRHLERASVILLLISPSFMASRYCYSVEMRYAMIRHEQDLAHVVPVLLRPILFTGAPFAKLQLLPTNGKPVVTWRNRDSAFVDVAMGIERLILLRLASPRQEARQPPTVYSSYTPYPPPFALAPPSRHALRPPSLSKRKRGGLVPVALSILGLLSVSVLLAQHLDLISLVGVIVGSLILLAGILLAGMLLAIQVLVERAQSRAARRREQGARRREYYKKALAVYEQALRQNNVDATAYRGKGNALVGLERYDEALTAFEQALALTPLPITYVHVGNMLTTLGRGDEAVIAYEQALALDASYASAYAGMSEALWQLGRTQEAERADEKAKQLGDDD